MLTKGNADGVIARNSELDHKSAAETIGKWLDPSDDLARMRLGKGQMQVRVSLLPQPRL